MKLLSGGISVDNPSRETEETLVPDTSTLPPLRWDTLDAAAESSGRTAGEIRRDNGLTPDWVRSPSGYDQPAQPSDVEDESPPDEK